MTAEIHGSDYDSPVGTARTDTEREELIEENARLRAALERLLAHDGNRHGYPAWVVYDDFGALCAFCSRDVSNPYDREATEAVEHRDECPIPGARALANPRIHDGEDKGRG